MKHLLFLLGCTLSAPSWGQFTLTKLSEEFVFAAPPFEQCLASSLVECTPNKLMVSFYGGSEERNKDAGIWLVKQLNRQKWTRPYRVAQGEKNDTVVAPCSNPVLFREKTGKLFLFYKMGANPKEWCGMLRTSDRKGRKWCAASKLPSGIRGPVNTRPVQLSDGTILWPCSMEMADNRWAVHLEKSCDRGKTWQSTAIDTACSFKVIQPSILSYKSNKLQMLCRSNEDRLIQSWSADAGGSWSKLDTMPAMTPNSGADAVTLQSGLQLLVYNPAAPCKAGSKSRCKLAVAVSKDGSGWQEMMELEAGEDDNEFSYPAVIQTQDGNIHITYTLNKKNIKHVVLKESDKPAMLVAQN